MKPLRDIVVTWDLLVVDAPSVAHSAFYSLRDPMLSRLGVPTNAVMGFYTTLLDLVRRFCAGKIVTVFDGLVSFRSTLFKGYRTRRSRCPGELRLQLRMLPELCRAMGWFPVWDRNAEACDLIASIHSHAMERNWRIAIVTKDRRLMMLMNSNSSLVMKAHVFWDLVEPRDCLDLYHVPPYRIKEVMALAGDPLLGIPGIQRVGVRTGATLVSRFGSAAAVFDHLEELPERTREKFREQKAIYELARALVELKTDYQVRRLVDKRSRKVDPEAFIAVCDKYGLERLKREFDRRFPLELFSEAVLSGL